MVKNLVEVTACGTGAARMLHTQKHIILSCLHAHSLTDENGCPSAHGPEPPRSNPTPSTGTCDRPRSCQSPIPPRAAWPANYST
eukprot:350149-Chlamydomonas_euryale.AAC.26